MVIIWFTYIYIYVIYDCDKLHEINIPRNVVLDEGVITRLPNIISGKYKIRKINI